MRYIQIVFFLSFNILAFGQKTEVLKIQYEVLGSSILAKWNYKNDSSNFQVSDDLSITLSRLNYLRNTLVHKFTPADSVVRILSNNFLGPLTKQIISSEYINFIISDTLLTYPLDLLVIDKPLFLQKKIFYSFEKLEFNVYNLPEKSVGLIVRDASADPDNGCEIAKELYKFSEFYNVTDLTVKNFEEFGRHDFMLISAHGVIQNKHKGYIDVNGKELLPKHISEVSPDLIYFDSCNLGISKSFISTFQQAGTKYLLAPIIKNQAGNSSTLTIKYFFESLKSQTEPVDALYRARTNIYNQFADGSDQENLLWYSFPFRIYKLN